MQVSINPDAMSTHTHYDSLKIVREAPQEVIRAARALAQRNHPDINNSPEAEQIMQVISEAYGVLSDPERRARYYASIGDQLGIDATDEEKTALAHKETKGVDTPQTPSSLTPIPSPSSSVPEFHLNREADQWSDAPN